MTATTGLLDEYSFAAEGMAGTAASAALRRAGLLARFSPTRKAVEAIATLAEIGGRVEVALAAGDRALASGERDEAIGRLDEAMALMDDMARIALAEPGAASQKDTRQGSVA